MSLTDRATLIVVLIGILSGCGPSHRSVHEGAFQKRLHRPGWHWGSGGVSTRNVARKMERVPKLETRMTFPRGEETPVRKMRISALPLLNDPKALLAVSKLLPQAPHNEQVHMDQILRLQHHLRTPSPNARLDPLAPLSLGIVIAGVVLAMGTTATFGVLGVLAAGIVIAILAIRRTSRTGGKGKGLAVVALVLGCVAALITAMAIGQSGL